MKVTFLGQGFSPKTDGSVGGNLERLFTEKVYHTFTGMSAFASVSGIRGLASLISSSEAFNSFNLIIGIDQQGTPKEALEEVYNIGINSYIFYQSEKVIFHPKIYLFEGSDKTSLIVGSSNLTAAGLFKNVESSLLVEFENDDEEGKELLLNIKKYYNTLFDFSDPNLFRITPEIIEQFVNRGDVPLKIEWTEKYSKGAINEKEIDDTRIEIPKRKTASLPNSFKRKPKEAELIESFNEEIEPNPEAEEHIHIEENLIEVWKTKPLTERDLNIPTGSNTNPTGSMGFSKGALINIDHRHYFRDEVFENLEWSLSTRKKSEHIELSTANFQIIIDGQNKGIYELKLSHNPRTDTKQYIQNNMMTNIRWGFAKDVIADRSLLGKTMTLYKNTSSEIDFVISID
ncbi:hypothetical protein E0W68_09525 [Flavobacterium salilacus subsp. salilacus]|uniref:phospholipase D family protein n=1 Tax=Flavobacterium TaxID=237 RepID=UPI001075198E|nr:MULTISPECIES: phospholipase D family protein [Flavobacterium]KAF2518254.1 hypothetical protein E0W68_09525 [Flavobacterium salilacus subsp. salilacus]MBE1615336.1 phospholipase D family protein [Flavobacterium sp. SaA2.13]